jgi:sugar phosphate isomerase/epimerase
MTRRRFLKAISFSALASYLLACPASQSWLWGQSQSNHRRFRLCLDHRLLGIQASVKELMRLANEHGFESIVPNPRELSQYSRDDLQNLLEEIRLSNLQWGASGLTVNIRTDSEEEYGSGINELPKVAEVLSSAGASRIRTFITPRHDHLTYRMLFRRYVKRIREVATILDDAGLRLGLEYVAPRHLRTSGRYTFIFTLAETMELIEEARKSNVGVVLDSFHWHNARETAADILRLKGSDVIACDLEDAPAGIPIDELTDAPRALPGATGVIDLKTFLGALLQIGFDGPVQVEPMLAEFKTMPADTVLKQVAVSLSQTLLLIE